MSDCVRALNAHHLFHSKDAAEAYRPLRDARVVEHAPFYVYGLWTVS